MTREILLVLLALFLAFLSSAQIRNVVVPTVPPSITGGFGGASTTTTIETTPKDCVIPDSLTNSRVQAQDLLGITIPIRNTALEQYKELVDLQDILISRSLDITNRENQGEAAASTIPISTLYDYLALVEAMVNDADNFIDNVLSTCTQDFTLDYITGFDLTRSFIRTTLASIRNEIARQTGTV
jgi:hypothetical protein